VQGRKKIENTREGLWPRAGEGGVTEKRFLKCPQDKKKHKQEMSEEATGCKKKLQGKRQDHLDELVARPNVWEQRGNQKKRENIGLDQQKVKNPKGLSHLR